MKVKLFLLSLLFTTPALAQYRDAPYQPYANTLDYNTRALITETSRPKPLIDLDDYSGRTIKTYNDELRERRAREDEYRRQAEIQAEVWREQMEDMERDRRYRR